MIKPGENRSRAGSNGPSLDQLEVDDGDSEDDRHSDSQSKVSKDRSADTPMRNNQRATNDLHIQDGNQSKQDQDGNKIQIEAFISVSSQDD